MFHLKQLKDFRLSRRQCVFVLLYTLTVVVALVVIHEAVHILTAMAFGVRFSELKLGFMGINPSVTLPEWFTGTRQIFVHYAGGLTAGIVLLLFYLLYWVRKYQRTPSFLTWSLGLITLVMAAMQFATGYLEGYYHVAYIVGAMSFPSPTDILTYSWAISAVFFHSSLCPWRRMNATMKSAVKTPVANSLCGILLFTFIESFQF
ncbi:hypothetical protein ACFLV0_03165 [Chloroflexota bacterium]